MSGRPILCGFDASEHSRLAARAAAWLAEALGTSLELVFVLDAGALPALPREGAAADPAMRPRLYALQEQRTRAWARAELETAASALRGIDVSSSVRDGRPVPVLQRLAAEISAPLLVSGTAARRGLEHVLRGSVAGSLAVDAPCPVVTVPPDAALAEPGPVLVGDDNSHHSRSAVRHAAALAERLARDLMRMQVEHGDPVEVMAQAAREHRACLAVTGTRGRGPVRGQLIGSVSSGIVRTAGRPVVLVPSSAGHPAY